MSLSNIVIILIVALLVIGPKKLPDMAKSIGKGYAEFRRAFNDLKKTVDLASDMSGKSSSRSSSSAAPSYKETYKSRWEEQIILPEEPAENKSAEPAQETAEKTTPPVRAKRADLIKESDNVKNG